MRDASSMEERIRTNPDLPAAESEYSTSFETASPHTEPEINHAPEAQSIYEPVLSPELLDFAFTNLANDSDRSIVMHRERKTEKEKVIKEMEGWRSFFQKINNAPGLSDAAVVFTDLIQAQEQTRNDAYHAAIESIKKIIEEPEYDSLAWQKAALVTIIDSELVPALNTDLAYHKQQLETKRGPSDTRATIKIRESFIANELIPEMEALSPNDPERQRIEAKINALRQDMAREKQQVVDSYEMPMPKDLKTALAQLEIKLGRVKDVTRTNRGFIERGPDGMYHESPLYAPNNKEQLQQGLELYWLDKDIKKLEQFITQKDQEILAAVKTRRDNLVSPVDALNFGRLDTLPAIPAVSKKMERLSPSNQPFRKPRPTQKLRTVRPPLRKVA